MEYIILVGGFIVVAVILIVILRMVLSGQSNTAIERLKRINQDNLQRELELKKKLDEAEAQYQKRMAEASLEIQKIKERMEGEVSLVKNKIIASAEREKEGILADARQDEQDMKTQLIDSMNERVTDFAREVIVRIFAESAESDKIVAGLHQYFIDEAVKKIRSLKTEMLASVLASVQEIEISTRLALTSHQKRALTEAFSVASSISIKITEKPPDPQSLAGISIKIGHLVIDATLNNQLKEIMAGMTIKEIQSQTK